MHVDVHQMAELHYFDEIAERTGAAALVNVLDKRRAVWASKRHSFCVYRHVFLRVPGVKRERRRSGFQTVFNHGGREKDSLPFNSGTVFRKNFPCRGATEHYPDILHYFEGCLVDSLNLVPGKNLISLQIIIPSPEISVSELKLSIVTPIHGSPPWNIDRRP
jgi:hypothetical protein